MTQEAVGIMLLIAGFLFVVGAVLSLASLKVAVLIIGVIFILIGGAVLDAS